MLSLLLGIVLIWFLVQTLVTSSFGALKKLWCGFILYIADLFQGSNERGTHPIFGWKAHSAAIYALAFCETALIRFDYQK